MMKKQDMLYKEYLKILGEELKPALGCTEPIAIAYATAKAVDVLGEFPEQIVASCSGNIIKNVKGVYVPNSGGLKGINASAIIGAVVGNPSNELQVLKEVSKEQQERTKELLSQNICKTELLEGIVGLYINIRVTKGNKSAVVEIKDSHTNIIKIEKNGKVIFDKGDKTEEGAMSTDRTLLTVEKIYDFVNSVDTDDVKELLDLQINYNMAIAQEGVNGKYGANVGATILKYNNKDDIKVKAKAYTAGGSDARMNGCSLPVIINSGSGNQGMTVSIPVIQYAKHLGVSDEKLYRALVMSNLVAIHQKTGIGRLSAYCGVVSAACASGAAITYLHDGDLDAIGRTIINTLGDVSGVVCDGAKASCAAKIASSIDAAIMSHEMSMDGIRFPSGEGIIKEGVEETIKSVGILGKDGMRETDIEILKIMID